MADRNATVYLKGNVSDYQRAMLSARSSTAAFVRDLDTSNDRMSLLVQSALALGPALVPVGAAAVPALAGLTNQLAFTVAGAGTAAFAFQGVGDALTALNDYSVEPTEANLAKMREAMSALGPAGEDFVRYLHTLRPAMQDLQDTAQAGLFPGMEAGMRDLETLLPQIDRIIGEIAGAMGEISAEAGAELAGPEWREFFDFLEAEARPTLVATARTFGNFVQGFANLWMAFDPLSDQFSRSFLDMARDFNSWADNLDGTEGFQEFLEYVSRVGPKVWDALGATANALVEIVEAAAPVGEVALPAIEAIADSIAMVADSDLGPAIIGVTALVSAYSRLVALSSAASGGALSGMIGASAWGAVGKQAKDLPAAVGAWKNYDAAVGRATTRAGEASAMTQRLGASLTSTAKLAGGAGGLAFVMSDLDNQMGLSNTAMMAMAGSMAGPWGAAVGGAVGLTMDLARSTEAIEGAFATASQAIADNTGTIESQSEMLSRARRELSDYSEDAPGPGNSGWADLYASQLSVLEGVHGANAEAARDQKFEEAGLGDAMDGASAAAREQTEALLENIDAHNRRANALLGDRAGMRDLEAAIDDANESIRENGRTLDINTEQGRANEASLDRIAATYNNLSEAEAKSADTRNRARESFYNTARDMGMGAERARELSAELFKVPNSIATEFSAPGASGAIQKAVEVAAKYRLTPREVETTLKAMDYSSSEIKQVQALLRRYDKSSGSATLRADGSQAISEVSRVQRVIDGMNGKTVRVAVQGGTGGGTTLNANGNIIDFYARGGLRENHVAQFAPAGSWRVWAEPETGGEAYIPLAESKWPRSREIWWETGKRIGMIPYADGGVSGGKPASAAPSGYMLPPGAQFRLVGADLIELIDSRANAINDNRDNFNARRARAGG